MEDTGESSNRSSEARDVLIASSHTYMESIINNLMKPKDTDDYKSAQSKYKVFVKDHPALLAIKLLQIYLSSSNGKIRIQSISLLSETIAVGNIEFSEDALEDIKPLVISCLKNQESQESEFKILGKIVSAVANSVVLLDNDVGWKEIMECILTLSDEEPIKAFHVFIALPARGSFIYAFLERNQEKAYNMLRNPEQDRVQDWSLVLITVIKMGVLVLYSEDIYDLIGRVISNIVNVVSELVKNGNEEFLVQGLDDLKRFLLLDKTINDFNNSQCHFVLLFLYKIQVNTTQINDAINKISQLVLHVHNPDSLTQEETPLALNQSWYNHLKTLRSVQVLNIFASNEYEDRSRELAIIRLNQILSDHHTSEKSRLDISVINQLQTLLFSCLLKEGIPYHGGVVNHVACEIFMKQKVNWGELGLYFAAQSKIDFQRTVYIFQCLTMPLEEEMFVDMVAPNLLQETRKRIQKPIDTPRESLVDSSSWVWGFIGAFCLVIHVLQTKGYEQRVKLTSLEMVTSVTALVERGTEDVSVRRAFIEVKSIVEKQLKWYTPYEYNFIKTMVWKLYGTKNMEEDTKSKLGEIYMILDMKVGQMANESPKEGEYDWLNQA
ncbi:hypothetical protein V5N11_017714 [Cardamine amara subsp. amara]|uniref:DUF577 domain-containing protein n=1 Tax=Cardamine amara subsp. amara TaxID=228776 RepID=A0ABD1C9X3_CARAN